MSWAALLGSPGPGLSEGTGASRDARRRTMPRSPTVIGALAGAALRPCDSFFRTLLALLLPVPGAGAEGNQERLMISDRLSRCLSS